MGRRKGKHIDDTYDSSDSGQSGSDFDGFDADERAEAKLFKNASKPKKRFTKEEAALGIWAEENDDDDDDFKATAKKEVRFERATAQTNVVDSDADSSADSEDDAMDVDEGDDADEGGAVKVPRDLEEEEDEMDAPRGLGLGLGAQHSFNSFNPALPSTFASTKSSAPSARPPPSAPAKPSQKKEPVILDARQTAINAARLNPTPDKDFMKFDKDGKGLSFLKKMGYKPGQGLGKDGAGIVNPIDVKLRPQKMGLGHRGFDERTQTVKLEQQMKKAERGESISSDDDADASKSKKKDASKKVAADQWRSSSTTTGKRKSKVSYKTADQLIQESSTAPSLEPTQKIIDMTGAQARQVRNMNDLSTGAQIAALREAASHLVELRYNVRTMASEAELDLVRLSKALTLETKTLARVDSEMEGMRRRVVGVQGRRERLVAVVQVAEVVVETGKKLEKACLLNNSGGGKVTAAEIDDAFGALFARIQGEFFDEYVEYRLDSLVVGAMAPLIKRMLAGWVPLEEPSFGVDGFSKWKRLFRFSVKGGSSTDDVVKTVAKKGEMRSMTPFESMMYNIWLPKVRQDINNNWNPLNPDPCISLLEQWYPSSPSPEIIMTDGLPELANPSAPHLLPPWIFNNIINQLVLPKLLAAIDEWDPRSVLKPGAILPHQWLFPWLPVLGTRFMTTICEPVKHKLAIFFKDWHPLERYEQWEDWQPSTSIGLRVLEPWKDVFSTKVFDGLVNRVVLPRLVEVLRNEFFVNPAQQINTPLEACFEWRSFFAKGVFQHLMETEFFGKWVQVLWMWCASPGCKFDEVSRWYLAWKGVFPEDMRSWEGVLEGFKTGLEVMNMAMSGEGVGSGPPKIVPIAERELAGNGARREEKERIVTGKRELERRVEGQAGFLELLERTAGTLGVVLLPTGRTHSTGKGIYKLEGGQGRGTKGVIFYIDDGVLFVYRGGAIGDDEGKWEAMGIDEVMGLARR
ncbi:hypothetical protein HDU79_005648 [Rhizoclosmatium sp. JEL0117]|nr:hypothetical protein HDU79_005648 [Rhizoclosmatium sp. JEL0117]